MRLLNPKNPEEFIEATIPQEECIEQLSKLNNTFAQSLVGQYRTRKMLSSKQWYYAYKLIQPTQQDKVFPLVSNLGEFLAKFDHLTFQFPGLGKVFLNANGSIFCGYYNRGKVVGDKYIATEKQFSEVIATELLLMSQDPITFMEDYGKETGYCCICGRLLTNEVSVARGIGPICAGRYGL